MKPHESITLEIARKREKMPEKRGALLAKMNHHGRVQIEVYPSVGDTRANLVHTAALIVAEIERLDRARDAA